MLKQIFLIILGIYSTAAVMHSWKAFYTASTGLSEFPEFVALNLVDDEPMGYFESKNNKFEGKQSWVKQKLGQEYEDQQTKALQVNAEKFKNYIDVAMKRFNQSKGAHIFQNMYGCKWDDETGEVTGYNQFGYDGEDFLIWDMQENRWVTPKQQAEFTTNRWNNNRVELAVLKYYFNHRCPTWLKKYVNYGRSSLMRTDLPSVSLLQKSSSSPVSCHATGFYPNRAEMFWRKDGDEVHDGVVRGEILPNNDGTFQMSVDINLSSVAPGNWSKYECVFQLSGVNDISHRLEKAVIRSNESNGNMWTIPVIAGVAVAAVALLGLIGVIGVFVYNKKKKKKNGLKLPVYNQDTKTPTPRSEDPQDSSSSLTRKESEDSKASASEKPLLPCNVTTN